MAGAIPIHASTRNRMIGIKPAILNTIAAHLKITFDLNIRKLRIIAPPDLAMCSKMFENRRDSRVFGLVVMAYDVIGIRLLPA